MQIRYVDDAGGLADVQEELQGRDQIALDCEAAGYHRYSDRLCLIQLTAGDRTFLIDPLAVDPGPSLHLCSRTPE
jgi:ribonuclease D